MSSSKPKPTEGMSLESYLDMYTEFTNDGDQYMAEKILGEMLRKLKTTEGDTK